MAASARHTERSMLDLLHARYAFVRPYTTARRYAVAEHVSNRGGTYALYDGSGGFERIADFLAQDTYVEALGPDGRVARGHSVRTPDGGWRTEGEGERRLVLHGHEVKVSRSDWLTELADPTKAQAWSRYCDRWWLVAPTDIVRPGELPDGWGHLAPTARGGLRAVVQAPLLDPEPMPVLVRAQVMRAVQKTSHRMTLRAVEAERGAA